MVFKVVSSVSQCTSFASDKDGEGTRDHYIFPTRMCENEEIIKEEHIVNSI